MTPNDERTTCPPGPADEDADAFANACRERGEWPARLENLARLHAFEGEAD